ncbi:3-oxo-5-alpha-steroid 4-dehydrogenase 1 [Hemicordylus capensis]|uniref:3-oxo-5-alpha-steroid 4-dehydrogenase 1 n=1 Tax=Hemicordylus capensis TaxID=884348 RepID=UPI00230285DE|nr:3-oxo-5-alpha-steroid 4-dehydrogenase 1 [Hemicordylus capensis]
MESLAAAVLDGSVFSEKFWRQISGPEEQRLMQMMSYGLAGIGVVVAILLRYINTPYGRHASSALGAGLPPTLGWLVQEAPSFLVPLLLVLCSGGSRLSYWPNRILLGLFLTHYAYRAFIFPFLIRGGKPLPIVTILMAFVFCSYNGYLQGRSLSNYIEYPRYWIKDLRFIIGLAAWLSGLLINIHSDHILRNLRKPGETGYKIPRGGLFEYVSGANFFGEIVEWFGFALACSTLESTVFAFFTFLILSNRARQHHMWYLKKFEDYPRSRKILIPFVY